MKVEELVYLVKLNSEAFLKGKARVDLELARMEKSADGAADAVEGVGDAAADAGDKLEGAGKKAGDAGKDFKGAGDDAKKAGDGFEESGEQAEGAGEKVEGAGKKSEKTGKKTDKLGLSLKKTGKDAAKFGKTTAQSFSKVTKYALGFFGVALTLEGARRFFVGTTNDIMALGNAASFMDMPIKQLDGFNKAAEAAGSSASAMGGVLMRVQNAVNWKNMPMGAPDASTMGLMRLDAVTGGKFKIMAAKNAKNMTLAMAQAMRSLPKPQAEQFAGMLGIDAGMFHDIMSGDFEKNQGNYSKKSGQTDEGEKRAREIKKTLTDIQTTAEGVGNAIYVAFGPAIDDGLKEFDKLLQEFGDYIVEHKDDIIGFFKDLTTEAGKFAATVGGSSNAFKILAGVYAVSKVAGAAAVVRGAGVPGKGVPARGALGPTVGIWLASEAEENIAKPLENKYKWLTDNPVAGFMNDLPGSDALNRLGQQVLPWRRNAPAQHAQAARRSPVNNPGNLRPASGNGFRAFDTARQGWDAMKIQLLRYFNGKTTGRKLQTIGDIVKTWAPAADNNDPVKYARDVASWMHTSPDAALNLSNPVTMGALMQAMARREGYSNWKSPQAYQAAYGAKDSGELSYMDEYRNYHANTGAAMAPGAIDNSQTAATHINAVHVTSNPATVDELTNSINEQSRRSRLTGAFISGVS